MQESEFHSHELKGFLLREATSKAKEIVNVISGKERKSNKSIKKNEVQRILFYFSA